MTVRPLTDFLKQGDPALGLPRRGGHARPEPTDLAMNAAAPPDLPPAPERASHDAPSADTAAALAWLWHVREGRIGS